MGALIGGPASRFAVDYNCSAGRSGELKPESNVTTHDASGLRSCTICVTRSNSSSSNASGDQGATDSSSSNTLEDLSNKAQELGDKVQELGGTAQNLGDTAQNLGDMATNAWDALQNGISGAQGN